MSKNLLENGGKKEGNPSWKRPGNIVPNWRHLGGRKSLIKTRQAGVPFSGEIWRKLQGEFDRDLRKV